MRCSVRISLIASAFALSGCAHIDYGTEGLTYYDPQPYLFVTTTKECVTTATVVAIPGAKRSLKLKSGYGTAELNATFTGGMLASIGQATDAKVPETLTAVAGLGTAIAGMTLLADTGTKEPKKELTCEPTAVLYPIDAAQGPDPRAPIAFPVKLKEQ